MSVSSNDVHTRGFSHLSKKKGRSSQKLKSELVEELSSRKTRSDKKRGIPVMTRLPQEHIDILDSMVKLDIFKSKSEAVALIVGKVLDTQKDKFTKLESEISKIERIQDSAGDIVSDALKSIE